MAEIDEKILKLEEEAQKRTDEFQVREQTIKTLTNILSQQQQPLIVAPVEQAKPPNYLLYAALALGGFFILRRYL